MSSNLVKGQGFGTIPVFLTSISTILGAILFLRMGYSVGHLGFIGTLFIIILGHSITIPTAMAIAEIATNQKVLGGGMYYIISRSFGITIGGAIGLALYLSQAISAAFYIIAFAESFTPLLSYLNSIGFEYIITDYRLISIPSTLVLILLTIYKGASLGVKMLYVVAAILLASLLLFFIGNTDYEFTFNVLQLNKKIENGDNFFLVFAICFPAFTGMAAGVGLSGDLKAPNKSIPLGTILATLAGMGIYILVAYKLYASASPDELVSDQLIMQKIASWGPIIPIGLAAAAISSAIGSILIAPRTLQAIAKDDLLPTNQVNSWLSKLISNNEPLNASFVTSGIIIIFVIIGDVNIVAQIITMFFMVTYGAICSISFLEHFASDPAYRPAFKSKWYLSLLGAVMCLFLMFKISVGYTIFSLGLMIIIYQSIGYFKEKPEGLSAIFQGVIFQLSRQFQIFLQKVDKDPEAEHWRPSIVCISSQTFERFSAFNLLRWMSHKYGFGTYIHLIDGYLSKEKHIQAEADLERLIKMSEASQSKVYLDTMVSPSATSAIAQVIQLPGMAGKENNMILFEFAKNKPEQNIDIITSNYKLLKATNFDLCVLASSDKNFGYKREIHVWITPKDYENASLMILLSFIILGHPEWKKANIKILALYPKQKLQEQKEKLLTLIRSGRLPISPNNVKVISQGEDVESRTIINEHSIDADLTIIGIRPEAIKHDNADIFDGYEDIGDVLFVSANEEKLIR